MTAKVYLSARDLDSPAKAAVKTRQVIADWDSLRVKTALGLQFRHSSAVTLVRPWWMPLSLYHRLLRSIVVETRNEERA